MPWYLYLALKQLFPTGKKFPFFTAISVLGVALGVALLVISTSVMGGFGYEIRRMIVDTQGEVQVRGEGLIADAAGLQARLATVPGVVATTPFAEGVVQIKFENKAVIPAMQGIDINRVSLVVPLERFIRVGRLDDLDDDSIILSSKLALSLGARIGSRVEIYSPLLLEKLKNDEVLLPRELRVVGIFEVGHQQLDSSVVLVTLRAMQELYGLGAAIHGVNVKIAPKLDADVVATRINGALPPAAQARARSWMEANQDFLFILQLEKNMIFFLLTFIIIVSAFSVTSSLLISVVRKTREIGLLGALGARPMQVAACFCFQGLLIGATGTVAGLGLGLGTLHFRNELVAAFTRLTASEEVLVRFYQFSQLPAHTAPGDVGLIVACSVVISTLAGLLPAWRAARLKPVEALRNE
ncbi:MAG: ABC transporter permease [Opitutia bacterium Tous-C4FEB]|nr:MAG: ABC transporter permease [Opitutae bacterium Tous-C5TDCM]PAW89189.1 MAG: ABC transporter permease [Opitutae bacterium Tous-C4FEB]